MKSSWVRGEYKAGNGLCVYCVWKRRSRLCARAGISRGSGPCDTLYNLHLNGERLETFLAYFSGFFK